MDIHQKNQIREVLDNIIETSRECEIVSHKDGVGNYYDEADFIFHEDDLIDDAMKRIEKILDGEIYINQF